MDELKEYTKNKVLRNDRVFSPCSAQRGCFKAAYIETKAFLTGAKKDNVKPGAWMDGPAEALPLYIKHSCSAGLGKMHVAQDTWKHRKTGQAEEK